MKIKKSLLGILLFTVLLLIFYYIHARFFKVDVVFYSAIFDGLLAALVSTVILYLAPYFGVLSSFEKMQLAVIFILGGYIFAISVPTVLDRSLSFYILEKIQERGGGIKESGFKEVFTNEYVKEHRLVDVRLTEQEQSGTIKIENGCVKLTDKGKMIVRFSRYFRKHFLPKHRLLMGEYTADLTDPFGHGVVDSNKTFNYVCK